MEKRRISRKTEAILSQDANALENAAEQRDSVLNCASPLALRRSYSFTVGHRTSRT